jgi:hypothetical protein
MLFNAGLLMLHPEWPPQRQTFWFAMSMLATAVIGLICSFLSLRKL